MIFIGIDIAKFDHCACVNNPITGEMFVEPFIFKNNTKGFELLNSCLKPYKDSLVGLEDTGHYGSNLINYLIDKNFKVALINPKLTKNLRKALGWSAKNDKKDSILITKLLLDKDNYRFVSKESLEYRDLKEITRRYHDTKEDINRYKNKLQKSLDLVFPEYNSLFSSKYSIVYNRVLKELGGAKTIANTDIRTIRRLFIVKGRGKRINLSAEKLKKSAEASIGQNLLSTNIEIKNLIATIELLETHANTYKAKIEEFSLRLNSPITTIPGISHISGMTIIAEIGDINNFKNAGKIISFAGLAPYVVQSGKYKASQTPITKTGSSYLRKSLYQCSLSVVNNNLVFHTYYSLKRTQGKTHRCAQSHVARKLLRIIHHLLLHQTEFDVKKLT